MFAIFSAKTIYAWASLVTTRLLLTLLVCLTATLFVNSAGANPHSALGFDNVAYAGSSHGRAGVKNSAQQQKIDLNTASADEIAEALSGVGPAKAQAMVKYRNEPGPFRSLDEVLEIKGFGPSILARNKSRILLGKVAKKQK